MQFRQQRPQLGKTQGASGQPLQFQLSSPTKVTKHNVLDGPRPQVLDPAAQTAAGEKAAAAAASKGRAKKTRWGPDQPAGASPPSAAAATAAAAPAPTATVKAPAAAPPSASTVPPSGAAAAGTAAGSEVPSVATAAAAKPQQAAPAASASAPAAAQTSASASATAAPAAAAAATAAAPAPAAASGPAGKTLLPASGFKGVISHRPPGTKLSPRPAAKPAAASVTPESTPPPAALPADASSQQQAAGKATNSATVTVPDKGTAPSAGQQLHENDRNDASYRQRSTEREPPTPGRQKSHPSSAHGNGDLGRSPSTEQSLPASRDADRQHDRPGDYARPSRDDGHHRDGSRDNGYHRDEHRSNSRREGRLEEPSRHSEHSNKRARHDGHYRDDRRSDRREEYSQHPALGRGSRTAESRDAEVNNRDSASHRRRDSDSHRRESERSKESDRSRSHSKTPGGGSGGRRSRRRSPSREEEGQIVERPVTKSPSAGQGASKQPQRKLQLSPSQLPPDGALDSQLPADPLAPETAPAKTHPAAPADAAARPASVSASDAARTTIEARELRQSANQRDAAPSSPSEKPSSRQMPNSEAHKQKSNASEGSRAPEQPQTQPTRARRRFEQHPPNDRKRSQTPDEHDDRHAKRSRNDKWGPSVRPQEPYSRPRQAPYTYGREDYAEADRRARHDRDRQHSLSPGRDAHARPSNSLDRDYSTSMSVSTSPSPGPKGRSLQGPQGSLQRHARTDSWHSDRPSHRRDAEAGRASDRAPLRLDDTLGPRRSYRSQHDPYLDSELERYPSQASWQSGSSYRHPPTRPRGHGGAQDYPHADHHHSSKHAALRHGDDRRDDRVTNGMRHDRWHSSDYDDAYPPPHAPRIAPSYKNAKQSLPPTASDAGRDRHHRGHRSQSQQQASGRASVTLLDRRASHAEQEAAAAASAKNLDRSVDNMMARLLVAYGKPAEAIGDKQVLASMKRAVRVMNESGTKAVVFNATPQDLPSWMSEAKQQQMLNMLVPATWLQQDPGFQPVWRLPVGWDPPSCVGDGLRPPAKHVDFNPRDGPDLNSDPEMQKKSPPPVAWSREEAEAGELGSCESQDPRGEGAETQDRPSHPLVLPMPLFPFLPEVQEPIDDAASLSPDDSQIRTHGGGPVEQLAPGGYLYEMWDMGNRPPSPAGSWSTDPTTHPSEWERPYVPDTFSDVDPSSTHLGPPAAPRHHTNTEQQYTDQVTTTSHAHWNHPWVPAGQQAPKRTDIFSTQHPLHRHRHQQQSEAVSGIPQPPEAPPPPPLPHPAFYPEPESGDYHIQNGDSLSEGTRGLLTLREDLRRGNAAPGISIYNRAEGYWLPLREARWQPQDLHWEGIDQMLMQGQHVSSPHNDSMSDAAIETWLDQTADSCQQHAEARQQLAHQPAIPSTSAAPPPDASATAVATNGRDSMLGSLSDSHDWFESFDLAAAGPQGAIKGKGVQSKERGVPKRWGPPAPPQYPAMLRGELGLAVMSGIAGKSLIKEILDKAIQHQLDKAKA